MRFEGAFLDADLRFQAIDDPMKLGLRERGEQGSHRPKRARGRSHNPRAGPRDLQRAKEASQVVGGGSPHPESADEGKVESVVELDLSSADETGCDEDGSRHPLPLEQRQGVVVDVAVPVVEGDRGRRSAGFLPSLEPLGELIQRDHPEAAADPVELAL